MVGLTPRQREVLAYLSGRDLCPSFREIVDACNLSSTSHARSVLDGLEYRGYIRRRPNRARAIEILKHLPQPPIIIKGRRYRFIPFERVEG